VKTLVFLLVLANLLFYAFSAGLVGPADDPDALRIGQQVSPESIRIVARGERPPLPAAAVPAPPSLPSESAEPVTTAVDGAEAAAAVPQVCLAWGALSPVEADRISRVVSRGFADFKLSLVPASAEGNGWWVYMPPLGDKAAADKKTRELKALGVSDYFVVQEGANRHAISLGVFSSEKRAQERLTELQGQGVRSARIGIRPDKDGNLRLEVRGPQDGRDALLAALAKAVPKSKAQDCP
jgi:hypothetical protein